MQTDRHYRSWIRIGIALLGIPAFYSGLESAFCAEHPNVLFIYTDDHSHRTVGCYPESYPWVRTPAIDRLAERGVRFTHAYIGTWCMPSRATMLTGLHPYAIRSMRMTGEYPGSTYDPALCRFWPATFRKMGYQTAQIGKWHTGTDTGFGRDWDYQVVWNRPRHIANAGNYYDRQLIETNGGKAVLVEGYSTDNYTNWAVDYIKGQNRDDEKPWYLWLCYGAVHGPFTPAERHLNAYPDIDVQPAIDILPVRSGKPDWQQDIQAWVRTQMGGFEMKGGAFGGRTVEGSRGIHGNNLQDWIRQYHQGVLAIDEGVDRLIETLEQTGQLENTLVIFTSDQGFAWGQHGFCSKLAAYDATIRSPLIVSFPGQVQAGEVCRTPVGGVDLVPTIFDFAGIKLPWRMHGHSLRPLLKLDASREEKMAWKHPVLQSLQARKFGEETHEIPQPDRQLLAGVPWWVSVVHGRYKYIRTMISNERDELYDLQSDPGELQNLVDEPQYRKRVLELRKTMLEELKRTDAGFVDAMPRVRNQSD